MKRGEKLADILNSHKGHDFRVGFFFFFLVCVLLIFLSLYSLIQHIFIAVTYVP